MSAAEIQLSAGFVTLVDNADLAWLNQWKWSALRSGDGRIYASRCVWDGAKNHTILMHRLITNAPKALMVDHVDRDGLNNQRQNLRVCSQGRNMLNSVKHRDAATSTFKGVWWHRQRGRWCAEFRHKKLGLFDTEIEAALAYDAAALAFDPAFARVNFPQGGASCLV